MTKLSVPDAPVPARPEPPATMRAIVMREFGDPGVLHLEEVAAPRPGPGEALLRVCAVEVSRTRDIATRTGLHPFSRHVALPHVLGGHFAGVVVSTGEGADPSLTGKRVGVMNHHTCGQCDACRGGLDNECPRLEMLGVHRWGSYAELTTARASILHVLPDTIDMAEAAALAATGPVALTQLRVARAAPGTVILVTGGTGALASALTALGSRLGATMIALSRRPWAVTPSSGLTVLDSARGDLGKAILAATGGVRPRAVIDNVCSADAFKGYFPTLANGGRIVVSGAIGTPQLPVLPVPARDLYSRTISLIGVRSHAEADAAHFWQLVRDGFRLPPGLIREYPLEFAQKAHEAVQDGSTTGHTVLRVAGGPD